MIRCVIDALVSCSMLPAVEGPSTRRPSRRARGPVFATSLRTPVAVILLFLLNGCVSLRDVRLAGPTAAVRGLDVELLCLYEMETDELYAVKWYLWDREFCRYSPRERPPLKVFPIVGLTGFNVDSEGSDAEKLRLLSVGRNATGKYTCEVSADAPSFHTAQVHHILIVVDLPSQPPELSGIKPRYRLGSRLRGECISANSLPAANLTFYVNDQPAKPGHVSKSVHLEPNGLFTSRATIQFTIHHHHFKHHKLKVRCAASMYTVYWRSTEVSADVERDKPPPREPPPDQPPREHRLAGPLVYDTQQGTNGAPLVDCSALILLLPIIVSSR